MLIEVDACLKRYIQEVYSRSVFMLREVYSCLERCIHA
jgi:hypothetical protein